MNRNEEAVATTPETAAADFGAIKESVSNLVDHGSEAVDEIRERVTEVGSEARDAAMAVFDEAEKFILAHPMKALALAFGAGYVAMRVRTSVLFPLALVGGLGYTIKRALK